MKTNENVSWYITTVTDENYQTEIIYNGKSPNSAINSILNYIEKDIAPYQFVFDKQSKSAIKTYLQTHKEIDTTKSKFFGYCSIPFYQKFQIIHHLTKIQKQIKK